MSGYSGGAIETSKLGHETSHYFRRNEAGHDRDIIHGLERVHSVPTKLELWDVWDEGPTSRILRTHTVFCLLSVSLLEMKSTVLSSEVY